MADKQRRLEMIRAAKAALENAGLQPDDIDAIVLATSTNPGDDALAGWIEANGAFPCTMVDRIVPATTEADIDAAIAALGPAADRARVAGLGLARAGVSAS